MGIKLFGSDEGEKMKPITLFYAYFLGTLLFAGVWFYFFISWYLGKPTIYETMFGFPPQFAWFGIIIGFVTPIVFFRQAIHYYKIVKFGVKSGWK